MKGQIRWWAVFAVVGIPSLLVGFVAGMWYGQNRQTAMPTPNAVITSHNYPTAEQLCKTYGPDQKLQQLLGSISASAYPELSVLRARLEEIRSQGETGINDANLTKLDEAIRAMKTWKTPLELGRFADEKLPTQWESLRKQIREAVGKAGTADGVNIEAMVHVANWHSALDGYDWKKSREELAGHAATFTKSGYPLLSYFEELLKGIDNAAAQTTDSGKFADLRQACDKALALARTLAKARDNPDLTVRFAATSPEKDQVVKEAEAEIAQSSGSRAQAIESVLGTWEKRMLTIPVPRDAAATYEQYKASLADRRKEYDAVRKWTLASDDKELTDLVRQAEESIDRLKAFVTTTAPEFSANRDQAGRILKLLQTTIKERGETRRQLFELTNKSFAIVIKQTDELIPNAVAAGSSNGLTYEKAIKHLRDEVGLFERDFKTMDDADIDARKKILDEALATLFRQVEEEVGTEDAVTITLPKFVNDGIRKELAARWDEYSAKVVGQTRPKIVRRQKDLLEPAKASIEGFAKVALELEHICGAISAASAVTTSGGEESQAAAEALPAMAIANGRKLISQAVQIDTARKTLTINSANLLAEQDKWNKAAGQWLACWNEIEKALNAGTGSTEKLALRNPLLADLTGDTTLSMLREKAGAAAKAMGLAAEEDPLRRLSKRLKTLEDFEVAAAPTDGTRRAAWLKDTFDALKADRLELAVAAGRRIEKGGEPRTMQEFKDLAAARKGMSKPAKDRLDKLLDTNVANALSELAGKGLSNAATVETTAATIEEIRTTMGLAAPVDIKDPVGRFNLALYRARQAQLKDGDNTTAAALARDLLKPDPGQYGDTNKNLVAGLQEQLAAWTKYQSQLGAKGGPKDANFTLNAKLSGDDVKVFERKVGDELRRLAFGRIIVNGDAVFLCTTETPIWTADALVENGKKLGEVLGIDEPVAGNKAVPRPWFTDNNLTELRIRLGWMPKYTLGFSPYPDPLRDPAAPEKLVAKSANPCREQPLDWISPESAKQLAASLGCRLATSAEWLAGATEQVNAPNLRDRSWEQVANQLNEGQKNPKILPVPYPLNKSSFAPSDGIVAWNGAGVAAAVAAVGLKPKWNLPAAGAYNDQHPFFWTADPELDANTGGKPRFKDLIGNVGEYVVDTDGQIHIAGGSALSDPAAGLGVQTAVAEEGTGHADVGLRLAFTPVKEGPQPEIARNIKKLLDDARYLTSGKP